MFAERMKMQHMQLLCLNFCMFFFFMILSYPLCHFYFSQIQLSSSQDTINTKLMEKITLLFCHLQTTLLMAAVLERKAADKR